MDKISKAFRDSGRFYKRRVNEEFCNLELLKEVQQFSENVEFESMQKFVNHTLDFEKMLRNECSLQKNGFDTTENESSKIFYKGQHLAPCLQPS